MKRAISAIQWAHSQDRWAKGAEARAGRAGARRVPIISRVLFQKPGPASCNYIEHLQLFLNPKASAWLIGSTRAARREGTAQAARETRARRSETANAVRESVAVTPWS